MTGIRSFLFKVFGFAENYCDSTDQEGLFVRFTDKCPNHCSFCIDANCPHGKKNASPEDMAKAVNSFGRKSIMLSGGEPCIDMKRLETFVNLLNNDIKIASLMTSLPKSAYEHKESLERLIQRAELIDISTHGCSNSEDEQIYGVKLGYDKQEFIQELAGKYSRKVFVSCVLLKEKFPEWSSVVDRIRHYYRLGVRNFYLNEDHHPVPFESSKSYISIYDLLYRHDKKIAKKIGKSGFCNACKLDLTSLFEGEFPGILVKCRRRCFRCGSGEWLSWRDVLKTLVNRLTLRKEATPVLNEDGTKTAWFTERLI